MRSAFRSHAPPQRTQNPIRNADLTSGRSHDHSAGRYTHLPSRLRVVGSYAYHFWMQGMTPLRRVSGNQYLHRKSDRYRQQVRRKLAAYHRHVQLGCIAQGLLQHLALTCGPTVWQLFRSWLRTMHVDRPPSELVVAHALRTSLPEFLAGGPPDAVLAKFLRRHLFRPPAPILQRAAA